MEGQVMAKRTFCDRCEAQCVNTTVAVQVTTIHHTKDGQYVGTDEHNPVEICLNCADELKQTFPQIFVLAPRDEMMMESPVREMDHDRAEARMPR
jgi:hypothetical protein